MKKLNFPNANINSKNISKIKIKALIIYGNIDSKIKKYIDNNGNEKYTGYFWDIWILLREKLKDKYEFEETFSNYNTINYDTVIKNTEDGVYDIVIDSVTHNNNYEKKITYTYPLLINSAIIIHEKKTFSDNIKVILNKDTFFYILRIILYALIIGIIIGFILWIFNPDRVKGLYIYKNIKNKNQKTKFTLLRSIMTGIASLIGESGYLSENMTNSYFSLILTIFLLVIGMIIALYLQSYLTSIFMNKFQKKEYSEIDIPIKECLSYKNDFYTNKLLKYGIKVHYLDNSKTLDDIINIYMNNFNKYGGIVSNYIDSKKIIDKYDKLVLSRNFNNEPLAYVINQNLNEFLEDINDNISNLRENLIIRNICNKYYKNFDKFICSLT